MGDQEPGHQERERISVVVAIHNALRETRACVESLLRHTDARHRLLLIDDASTDRRMRPMLEGLRAGEPRLEIFRNERNLGYTATVNRGCRLAGRDDVVLLNSDTVVTATWLEKLAAAASSRPRVATVTPLSNAAGAFSVPVRHRVNRLPPEVSIEHMSRLVEQCSERLYPEVPTGNGFCLFVSREAIDVVGLFDAEAFPRGCGEENDFCMRARAAGFVHLIDDTTFVFHERSASMGWRKRLLLYRAARLLRRRHPSYEGQVARWLAADPLDPLRTRLQDAWREAARS